MTGEPIGTARVDIVVNTEQWVAGVATMDKSYSGMAKSVEQSTKRVADSILKTNSAAKSVSDAVRASGDAVEQNSKRQVASLQKQIAFLGASREEQLRWTIAQRTSGETAALLTKQLDAQVAKLKQVDGAVGGNAKTAKELQFALRGLPAQITDIVTGIASGQRPLTILFQQGGQLKDMFGGIVPAARALGSAVLGMVNPFTIAAAAIAATAVAMKSAADEADGLNKAIILTGNFARTSTDDLRKMGERIAQLTGATVSKSTDVVAQVAATGRFTADQIELVAKAAVNLQKTAGVAIEDTVRQFVALADDPVRAMETLNKSQNAFTSDTKNQIKALADQGQAAQAAGQAINDYANTLDSRADQINRHLSGWSLLWKDVGTAAASAFDQIKRGLSDTDAGTKAAISTTNGLFAAFSSTLGVAGTLYQRIFSIRNEAAKAAQGKANFGNVIGAVDTVGADFGKHRGLPSDFGLNVAPPAPPKVKRGGGGGGGGFDAASAAIAAFEQELKKEQGLLANETQVLEANYAARTVTVEKFYDEQKRLTQENTAAQEKALQGEIAALQSRNASGQKGAELASQIAGKEAELAKVRADGATKLQVLNIQEAAQLKQRQSANQAYADALGQQQDALKAELDSQVLRVTVGEREFEIRSRIIQLYRDEAKELLNLARQRDAGEIDPNTYEQRVAQLQQAIAAEVRIVRQGYDQMAQAQQNWANGAIKAFADYQDAANDVAGQTYGIFSDALHGLEDVFVDFFTKGKADWKGFFDGIAAEITRFVVRQQLSKLAKKFLPGLSGGEDQNNNAQALTGAASSLAASAGPLYGAAGALSAAAAALAAAGTGNGIANAASGSSGSSGGFWSSLISSFFSSGGEQWYAKGGAFSRGAEVKAFAYGGVVGSPTYFPMAGGKMGLMGEEKPEAIMPLKRGPDGRLGVVAQVQRSNAPAGPAVVHQTLVLQGRPDSRTPDQYAQAAARGQNRVASRNR